MGDLIPTYTDKQFVEVLMAGHIKEMKSCEVVNEAGESQGFFTVPQTDFIKMRTEFMGQLSNSVGGKDLAELMSEAKPASIPVKSFQCHSCPETFPTPIALGRHVKDTHKKTPVAV